MILDTCSTIEIMICLKKIRVHLDLLSIPRLWGKKCQNVILSSTTYQNAPGPSGHTNIKVGSEAAIVTSVLGSDGIHNLLVYNIIQYYITIVITCIQYNYK